jgi:hypothetical protein
MEVSRLQVAFEATGQRAVQSAIASTDKSIHKLADSSVTSANKIGASFLTAGNLVKATFGAALAVGVGKVGASFLNLNAQAEQFKISLETVTGSAARANAIFGLILAAGVVAMAFAGSRTVGSRDATMADNRDASDVAAAAARNRQTGMPSTD